MGNEMGNETVDRHRCDEVASTPQSKLTIQQSAVPIEKSSSCGQATKRWRTTLMKRTEKGLVNRKSGGQGAHSQTKDGLRFAVHEVAHFPDGCVCLWINGLFQFQHFGAAHGGSSLPWFKPEIPPCCPPTQDCQLHCQHSIPLFHSCNGIVAIQRVRSKLEGIKTCQQQSRHAHLDDRCVGKKTHWKNMCSSSPKSQIAIDSARSVS